MPLPPLSRIPGVRQVPQAVGSVMADTVLFDSWGGQYSDSPKAISEEMHRTHPHIDQHWVFDATAGSRLPDWATPVAPGGARHLSLLGRARYLVANNTVAGYHRKRRGTTFMQTWHGTPLKRIGFDIRNHAVSYAEQYERTLRTNAAAWDVLVAPNAFSTSILQRALGFEGPIHEIGYPRNDLLQSPEAPAIRQRVRAALGLADGETAVLYAPTFRDDRAFASGPDLGALATQLGDGYRLLVRAHSLNAQEAATLDAGSAVSVSDYPEVAELYLAADILVTDYSSVMFDFAITGKPMVFFTYDLEDYRDRLRGFYFDFEAEAPGPLVRTPAELVEAVSGVGGGPGPHAEAYARFREKFCALEDGRASQRAVQLLVGGLD